MFWMIVLGVICILTMFATHYVWSITDFGTSVKWLAVAIVPIIISIFIQDEKTSFYAGVGYIILGIITVVCGLFFLLGKTKNKAGAFMVTGLVILLLGLFGFNLIFNLTNGSSKSDYEDTYSKVTYKKCAWCGDMVRESDMTGKWCDDCNEAAFGNDGWYHEIKD